MRKALMIGLCVFLYLAGLQGYQMRLWEKERRATFSVYLPPGVRLATDEEAGRMAYRLFFDEETTKEILWGDFEREFKPLSLQYYRYFLNLEESGLKTEYLAMGNDGIVYQASDWLGCWMVPYKSSIEKEEDNTVTLLFERDFQSINGLQILFTRLIILSFSIAALVVFPICIYERNKKASQ